MNSSSMENFVFLPKNVIPTSHREEEMGLQRLAPKLQNKEYLFCPMSTSVNLITTSKTFSGVALNNRNLLYPTLFYILRDQSDLFLSKLRTTGQISSEFEFENLKARLNVNHARIIQKREEDEMITDINVLADLACDFYHYLHNTDLTYGLITNIDGDLTGKYQGFSSMRHISHLELRGLSHTLKKNKASFSDLHWKSFCFNYLGNRNSANIEMLNNSAWLFSIPNNKEAIHVLVELSNDILPVLNRSFTDAAGRQPLFLCVASLTLDEHSKFVSQWGGSQGRTEIVTRNFIISREMMGSKEVTTLRNYNV